MTVTEPYSPDQYTGTGANTALPTTFVFNDSSEIVVTSRVTATGAETVLTETTHYTVTGGDWDTGTVTPVDGATDFPTTVTWTLSRETILTQETDWIEGDDFPAASHERAADKLTLMAQERAYRNGRALHFPDTDDADLDGELPSSIDRATNFLAFDADGEPIASAGVVPTDVTVSTFMEGVVASADEESARDLLDITDHADNAIINGCCRVAQRGAYTMVSSTYGFGKVDRIEGSASALGAASLTQSAAAPVGDSGYALHFSAVTMTQGRVYARYRMESRDAVRFKNGPMTFSVRAYQDTGSTVGFTIIVSKANAQDNFAAVTTISSEGPTDVGDTTDVTMSISIADMGDCSNGIQIVIYNPSTVTTVAKNFYFTEFQAVRRADSSPFTWRRFDEELLACQRYFEKTFDYDVVPAQDTGDFNGSLATIGTRDTGNFVLQWEYKVEKRDTPTVTTYNPDAANSSARNKTGASDQAVTAASSGTREWSCMPTAPGAGDSSDEMRLHATADAEF